MKSWTRLTVVALLMIGSDAYAQTRPDFLAMDVFGGFQALDDHPGTEDSVQTTNPLRGWNVGSTLRFDRWWGLRGEFARTWNDLSHQQHYLGGVEFTDSYAGDLGTRFFGYALAGYVTDRSEDGVSNRGSEIVLGGGLDALYVFRLQFDYARLNLPVGRPKDNLRFVMGGVLPLCFRGCRNGDKDGVQLGRLEHEQEHQVQPGERARPSASRRKMTY